MKYDMLVVGCGFAGTVLSYLSAARLNKKVLVLERRGHIAGNMYEERDEETGILVQKYGPHIFVSDQQRVYDFVTELGEWVPYTLRGRADIDGTLTPVPFNFQTVDAFFPDEEALEIKTRLVSYYRYAPYATIIELMECPDPVVQKYTRFLLEKDYRPYIMKQWGLRPDELDLNVISRVPVRLTYSDQYFDKRYQMQPRDGYTAFFKKLLDHPNIEVRLNTDALDQLKIDWETGEARYEGEKLNVPLVYTGALDELMKFQFGKLPYRSRVFEYKKLDGPSYQETAVVVHPTAPGYIRTTEFSKLMPNAGRREKTIVAVEYPVDYDPDNGREAYYPTLTEESKAMYRRYLEKTRKVTNFYPCGRLAEFRYYNMDDVIDRALSVYEEIWRDC